MRVNIGLEDSVIKLDVVVVRIHAGKVVEPLNCNITVGVINTIFITVATVDAPLLKQEVRDDGY